MFLLGVAAASQLALTANAAGPEKLPNIVFVLVDDMGIGDVNCYFEQSKIKTPHLDELASKSLQFMQHYSGATVSAPSRCCLMTGKHTGNAYVRGNKGVVSEKGRFDLAFAKRRNHGCRIAEG